MILTFDGDAAGKEKAKARAEELKEVQKNFVPLRRTGQTVFGRAIPARRRAAIWAFSAAA